MNNSAMPLRLTVVFAASGDRNSIPTDATTETLNGGKASFDVGFPQSPESLSHQAGSHLKVRISTVYSMSLF